MEVEEQELEALLLLLIVEGGTTGVIKFLPRASLLNDSHFVQDILEKTFLGNLEWRVSFWSTVPDDDEEEEEDDDNDLEENFFLPASVFVSFTIPFVPTDFSYFVCISVNSSEIFLTCRRTAVEGRMLPLALSSFL